LSIARRPTIVAVDLQGGSAGGIVNPARAASAMYEFLRYQDVLSALRRASSGQDPA
jgi:hypothetical protein